METKINLKNKILESPMVYNAETLHGKVRPDCIHNIYGFGGLFYLFIYFIYFFSNENWLLTLVA